MKTISVKALLLILTLSGISLFGQKKVHTISVSRIIPSSASSVWQVVGEDFGTIANFHPQILSSSYINGPHKVELGAERVCYLDRFKTRYKHERIVEYDPSNYSFKVKWLKAEFIFLDPKYCHTVYSVKAKNAKSCELSITLQYRAKLSFLGGIAKNGLVKLLSNHAIGIQHHVLTGEEVTRNNLREIKKKYKS